MNHAADMYTYKSAVQLHRRSYGPNTNGGRKRERETLEANEEEKKERETLEENEEEKKE